MLVLVQSAWAVMIDDGLVEYWAGAVDGDYEAVVVVDFAPGSSFAFGYRWNDGAAPTGWDALSAINAAGALDVTFTPYSWGVMVNDFAYGSVVSGDESSYSWGYYIGDDGVNWTAPTAYGVSGRPLVDGCWDGWSWGGVDDDWNHLRAPITPTPEPISMVLLGLGGMIMSRRRQ